MVHKVWNANRLQVFVCRLTGDTPIVDRQSPLLTNVANVNRLVTIGIAAREFRIFREVISLNRRQSRSKSIALVALKRLMAKRSISRQSMVEIVNCDLGALIIVKLDVLILSLISPCQRV